MLPADSRPLEIHAAISADYAEVMTPDSDNDIG
jgi:hypothetical protein